MVDRNLFKSWPKGLGKALSITASLFITEICRRQDIKGPRHDVRSSVYVLSFMPKMVYLCTLNDWPKFERKKSDYKQDTELCKQARVV